MKRWKIFYTDQEHAKRKGRPLFIIESRTKKGAILAAAQQINDPGHGLRDEQDERSRCDYCHNLAYAEDMTRGRNYTDICLNCRDIRI